MLQPREADIPALLLFFVVFPLVTYFLLGKCNEASKKKARVSVLAQLAAEEALKVETMAAVEVVPVALLSNFGLHQCARCFGPATTRCSRCKSVRYCSGKCQIIHWRQGHKQECQQWKNDGQNISSDPALISENDHLLTSSVNDMEFVHNNDASGIDSDPSDNQLHCSSLENEFLYKKDFCKIKKELPQHEEDASYCKEEANGCITPPSIHASNEFPEFPSNEASKRYKSANNVYIASDSISFNRKNTCQTTANGSVKPRNFTHETQNLQVQDKTTSNSSLSQETSNTLNPDRSTISGCKTVIGFSPEKARLPGLEYSANGELGSNSSTEKPSAKGGTKFRKPPYTVDSNSVTHKSPKKSSRESCSLSGLERKACREKESYASLPPKEGAHIHDANEASKSSEKKMQSAKASQKPPRHGSDAISNDCHKKNKVLFPYEDLVKFFQCEISDVYPRGLLNCGNSCYANAVLQCLTSTKPLLVYLLRGIHSRSCYVRDWCLMCELELHVSTLLEVGGPLSPSRVLSNMRNIGCRIGGGTQEDAHEFLRLVVMSMQSISLEGLGGEKEVDPRLQETTLIQQLFGGRLRSKVKCLKCESESERYENIMDLTLEIHGWVESLEDALTQFTAPEDLDGDNMYRCGRCCTYVKARKQLSVHEAPNILTIVLKRFQTGKYGKINKCVTFCDILDMKPFMTGTSDRPPDYMLYAVVVHLDTLNASFSGHYISYVKDLQGHWFRIDDTEVLAVSLSQVMSEGAYMLFYARSFPRPPRIHSGKTTTNEATNATSNSVPKLSKTLKSGWNKTNDALLTSNSPAGDRHVPKVLSGEQENVYAPKHGRVAGSSSMDISDSSSSDWSLFTSSDESSFTTESTSDSFSTVDYSDGASIDPISSFFSPAYKPGYPQKTSILCRGSSQCRPKTRFFSESKSYVVDYPASVHKGKNAEEVISGKNCSMYSKVRERSHR